MRVKRHKLIQRYFWNARRSPTFWRWERFHHSETISSAGGSSWWSVKWKKLSAQPQ